MASYINIKSGFNVQTGSAIDRRILLSKAEMLTIESECILPDKYFCICTNDGKLYLFDNTSTYSSETGHFTPLDQVLLQDPTWIEQALAESAKFTTLEAKVGDAEAGTGLAGEVKVLQTDVTQLKTDVNILKPEVAQLKQEVEDPDSGLAKRIQELETKLTNDLEPRVVVIEEWLKTVKLDNISGTISGEEVTL